MIDKIGVIKDLKKASKATLKAIEGVRFVLDLENHKNKNLDLNKFCEKKDEDAKEARVLAQAFLITQKP